MGNRRSDPWSIDLTPVCPSTAGWPKFDRIFPILDWSYAQVWQFLNNFNLCYCSLYSKGYTSLGEKHNSRPNPALLGSDGKYKHASALEDESQERLSRC